MSSSNFGENASGPLAVLAAQADQEPVDALDSFCERLSPAERQQIQSWNATEHSWPDDPCLHDLIEAQARQSPEAIAVICGNESLTYRQLNSQSHQLATQLLEAGAVPQEPIGLVADCSLDAIIGALGILKAGCAYLPLDTTLPDERWRYFLQDAAVRFIVGQPNGREWLNNSELTILQRRDTQADLKRLPKVTATGLAYVLYTSGSTGKAKGVMLDHRGPVNTIRDINQRFAIRAQDRVLALSSLGFDLSVYDLFGTLAVGGTIIQPTLTQSRDPEQWSKLMHQHSVSVWNTVPALMDMLVTYNGNRAQFPHLRLVMLSGDWIPVSLPDRIRSVASSAQVVSLGGSTEASIWSVLYPIDEVDTQWRSIPYGYAMLNQRCYVVDTDFKLCPIGEVGELCLAGVGVAQGYLNRAELSAERFLPDPFDPHGRLYRTGDLCRYQPDGTLEFLGRRDHQVKIRGYRIGLGEIESEIGRLPAIREAAVIASEEATGARLIAYVVLQTEDAIALEELNAQLRQTLPEYMLPSAMVILTALPLSPNGKVDRRQLPLPTIARSTQQVQLPVTPTETIIHGILCQLLRLNDLDVRDDFYALGGNSLSAVVLVSRIRESFGIELSVPELLCHSFNIVDLAAQIDRRSKSESEGLPAARSISNQPLSQAPLSYSQQQLWVVNFLDDQRKRYIVPLVYDVQLDEQAEQTDGLGGFDIAALQFALDQLVARHDILRTVYETCGSHLQQIVLPVQSIAIRHIDLRAFDEHQQAAAFHTDALESATAPFDLRTDWPIRVSLYHLSDAHWKLVIAIHHIAIDGVSVNILQQEIAASYQSYRQNKRCPKHPLRFQYANYALWQHEALPPSSFELDRGYWQKQLSGPLPVLDLVEDRNREASAEGETLHFQIDGALLESVHRLAQDNRSTPFITLLAAIKAVLQDYTSQDDIIVGTPISTREDSVTDNLIGYFINVLPLRTRLDVSEGFLSLLNRVRGTVLEALAHRNYPLELLKREVLTSEAAGQDPFRVMFVLEEEPETLSLPGLKCSSEALDTQTTKFDLLIAAFVSDRRIRFELQYRCSCFDRRRIVQFGEHLRAFLTAVVAAPQRPLTKLEWLPMQDWSVASGSPCTVPTSCWQQFLAQVKETPDAVAVRIGQNLLTYAELNDRSAYLAGWLHENRIKTGDRVAINLPRSLDMVIAVLGTLRAGGAYVPVDPAWPEQRRAQVISDCQPALALTYSHMEELRDAGGHTSPRLDCDQIDYSRAPDQLVPASIDHDADDLAYILYTSGSTGKPKGVAMRWGALNNLIAWQCRHSQTGVGARTLQFASLGFDVSFQEIFATLCSGGQLVLVEEQQQRDLNQLWKLIVQEQIERLFLPYVALRGLCEIAGASAKTAALREVITAGEQLQITPTVREFFARLPQCRLWNQYGPTESHVVTAHLMPGEAQDWQPAPPIGTPLDNCQVAILDQYLRPVPRGALGELYLGGECLATGYFNNPKLTSERFIANNVANCDTRILYRTGDLGWLNWDGQLEFVGRNDHQVKVRGHRVELAEIELELAQCVGIQQAIVTVHSSGASSQLRAHLLVDGEQLDLEAVKRQLSTRLPSYMVPAQYNLVKRWPLTATGKVDRQKLADETLIDNAVTVSREQVHDPIFDRLKLLWQEVLAIDDLSIDASFFDCGGDSLSAAILFARLESEFGRSISISTLVERPTIRQLSEVYRQLDPKTTQRWEKLVPLRPHGERTPIICLPGIDGHFLNFRHMIGLLDDDRPMFGLQPIGLSGAEHPLSDIKDIAANHVEMLRAALPQGPYNLVGFSFGGIVAYEMAQILRSQGQAVSLALIDCSTGGTMKPGPLQSIAFHFRYARQLPPGKRTKYLLERVHGFWLGLKFKLKLIDWETRLAGLIDVQGRYAQVAAKNMQALTRYRPEPALGPAVLYRAKLRANWPGRDRTDPASTWIPLFRNQALEVVDIDGAHGNILNRPNVDRLVEHLSGGLL